MRALDGGWEVLGTDPGGDPAALPDAGWLEARVPGTVAGALRAAGLWAFGDGADLDARDWWFRCSFEAGPDDRGAGRLEFGGLATQAEVWLNGEPLLESASMWLAHDVAVGGRLGERNELLICCRALAPLLRRRGGPRARWRTRVVNDGALRRHRTMIFGRSPGFAPEPAAVGPWRPVVLHAGPAALTDVRIRARLDGQTGVVEVGAGVADPGSGSVEVVVHGRNGEQRVALDVEGGRGSARVEIADAERWWPHTHGEPVLHDVVLERDGEQLHAVRVGFRTLEPGPGPDWDVRHAGLDLRINGVAVWARGAVWTPLDLVTLAPGREALRGALATVRDAGMNMLRIPGTTHYESRAFHGLCDELGILVWQDLMFANLDYPAADPDFRALVEAEVRQVLAVVAGRPSTTVVCGNSEVDQQAAMLGLDPTLARNELFDELAPALVAESGADAVYIPSTPWGGTPPFRPDVGIAHYFGVTGYFRQTEDARRAELRFAAECLAFAHVPDVVSVPPHHPDWKRAVPRDAGTGWGLGSGWDFDDVRDHYLATTWDVDPVQLRRADLERYLELCRAVTGEVSAEVLGEWRRARSTSGGALVLWLSDLQPGAGLGLLEAGGAPKQAFFDVARVLAPVAVWTTDEGLSGIAVHVANDRGEALSTQLRVALFSDGENLVDSAEIELELAPHETLELNVEEILGRWVDVAWSYRFGPPVADVVTATLGANAEGRPLAQAFRLVGPRSLAPEPAERLGLSARLAEGPGGVAEVELRTRRFAHAIRIDTPGHRCDQGFSLEPGGVRRVRLEPESADAPAPAALVRALNLAGSVRAEKAEEA